MNEGARTRVLFKFVLLVFAGLAANLAMAWVCAAWSPIRQWTPLPEHTGPGWPEPWPGGPYREPGWWTTRWGFGFTEYNEHFAGGPEGDFAYWNWRGAIIRYRNAGWPMRSFRSTVEPYYEPGTSQRIGEGQIAAGFNNSPGGEGERIVNRGASSYISRDALFAEANIGWRVVDTPGSYPRRWDLPLKVILKRGVPTDDLPSFLKAQSNRRLPLIPIWPGLVINTLFYCGCVAGMIKLGATLGKVFRRLAFRRASGAFPADA